MHLPSPSFSIKIKIMQNQLIQTFCNFVRIDSPTGSEWKFSNYLRDHISKLNIPVRQDGRGNLFVSFRGAGEPLLLVAHLDTVEPGRGIVPVVKKGVISSKGETILGADNKAIVAILFELMRFAQSQRIRRAFEVLLSVSEEGGISGIDTFNFAGVRSKKAFCFDVAKPFGTIILGSPYYLRQDICIRGKEADASITEKGQSVIPTLAEFLRKAPCGIYKDSFYNIGVISGGNATNALLSNVFLQGEVRSFTKENLVARAGLVKSLIQKIAQKNNCAAFYNERLENHGYQFNSYDKHIKYISEIMRESAKRPIRYYKRYWGVSDANNLNKRGIKTLNLGYGARNPHTTKEAISIQEMEIVFKFLQTIIK